LDASREATPELRPLAALGAGAEGTIVELRLAPARRVARASPLREGTTVYVVEASGGGWLHVRINFREYSVPPGVAERVMVAVRDRPAVVPVRDRPAPLAPGREAAGAVSTVLFSRAGRMAWRVRVVHRGDGAIVLSEAFGAEADARRRLDELLRDAASLDAASFRARHRLP
jgi:FeoA domain